MNPFQNLTIDEPRHTISELCHVCGVTRAMILNFEKHGLIEALWTNDGSGYRYYGAQSVARICHIRSLQKMGMSLDSIARFLKGDESVLQEHLVHLQELQKELRWQLERTEALLTPPDTFAIKRVVLPAGDYVMVTENCQNLQERFLQLWRFTAHILKKGWPVANTGGGLLSILHTKPGTERTGMTSAAWAVRTPNAESVHWEETEALLVHVRGPYTQISKVIEILRQYAAAEGLPTDGDVRVLFITSPQSHVQATQYVTSVYLELE